MFIQLNFRLVFRGSKTNVFPERFVFLISDDIKEDHIRCCLIAEREKQNPLGTKLVVIVKDKRSIIWEN